MSKNPIANSAVAAKHRVQHTPPRYNSRQVYKPYSIKNKNIGFQRKTQSSFVNNPRFYLWNTSTKQDLFYEYCVFCEAWWWTFWMIREWPWHLQATRFGPDSTMILENMVSVEFSSMTSIISLNSLRWFPLSTSIRVEWRKETYAITWLLSGQIRITMISV